MDMGASEADLERHFAAAGEVVRCFVMQWSSGLSQCYGMVEFETSSEADSAVLQLTGQPLRDCQLRLRMANT
ncbi:MAG: RNA-binding protein [Pseudomonadota bacterium]